MDVQRGILELLGELGLSDHRIIAGLTPEWDFKCAYCGLDFLQTLEHFALWEKDHVIPSSKGGPKKDPTNHAPSCRICNSIKRSTLPKGENLRERIESLKPDLLKKRRELQEKFTKIVETVVTFRASRPSL